MPRLEDLPREVIRAIALAVYDPMELTQQDRLTWGIFSTVDMHPARQVALTTLVSLGQTCRRVRSEVRILLFRCIRILTVAQAEEVIAADWAPYVRSLIVDLSMFDPDETVRSFWSESALLIRAINALPCLEHLCFFADASDDTTLALLFTALVPRDLSLGGDPEPTAEPRRKRRRLEAGDDDSVGYHDDTDVGDETRPRHTVPLAARLKSFGWRQRAAPPAELRHFSQTSTFASTLHLLRHAHKLSFLILDADVDEMVADDVIHALRELAPRKSPASHLSLMLCGRIAGWDGLLPVLAETFGDIKELFIDRPLKKNVRANADADEFCARLEPLAALPHLQLIQVGSYTFTIPVQREIVRRLAYLMPGLLAVGLLGQQGDTTWWGTWRRAPEPQRPLQLHPHGTSGMLVSSITSLYSTTLSAIDASRVGAGALVPTAAGPGEPRIAPLGDGHLFLLEDGEDVPADAGVGLPLSLVDEIVRSRRSSGVWGDDTRSRRSSIGDLGDERLRLVAAAK